MLLHRDSLAMAAYEFPLDGVDMPSCLRPEILVLLVASALAAQQQKNVTTYNPAHPIAAGGGSNGTSLLTSGQGPLEPVIQVAPIFIEDGQTSSSLVIVNNSAVNAGATISIHTLSGAEVTQLHKSLKAHEQKEIQLQPLLAALATPVTVGSVIVTQDANLKGMTVASQLLLTNTRGSLPSYVDEELAMPEIGGTATL